MTNTDLIDVEYMRRALDLATRGIGRVEPNPMVGCIIVRDGNVIGEGWHDQFGSAHAEVNALARVQEATDSTLYVTLEPCCHTGKTPPCTKSIIHAKVRRVVIGTLDPSEKVAGKGVQQLRDAGIEVSVGVCQSTADQLIAPFRKLTTLRRPWLIAKWAMTLDGKIATKSKDSRWISNSQSREIVHRLRGRVDAIMVGRGTAVADDPLLTARPKGLRVATRIVIDSNAEISESSQLVQTAADVPVLIAVGPRAPAERKQKLLAAGCELYESESVDRHFRLVQLFEELGRREMTNVLCEGGSQLFGSLFDQKMIDEVHAFIAPKLLGGENALSPIAGRGHDSMSAIQPLVNTTTELLDEDIYVRGIVDHTRV